MDEGQLTARIERNKATEIRIRLVEFGGRPFGDVRTFVDGDGDPVLAQNAAPQNRWAFGRLQTTHKRVPRLVAEIWSSGGCVNID